VKEEEVMVMEGVPVEGREKKEADEYISVHVTDVISTFPFPPKEIRETENRFDDEEEASLIVKVDNLIVPVVVTEKRGETRFPTTAELCWTFTKVRETSPVVTEKRAEFTQFDEMVGIEAELLEIAIVWSSIGMEISVNVPAMSLIPL
jgi:hypothetical protein